MSPTHADTPCVEPGCFAIATHRGRCASCQLAGPAGHELTRGSARERGYDRKWERRRQRHLAIEPFCRTCGKLGNEVDHVIPHRGARWLFDLDGNLQTLCKHHHSKKTGNERTIPIGMMYPLELPEPRRVVILLCGPGEPSDWWADCESRTIVDGNRLSLQERNDALWVELPCGVSGPLWVIVPAPRTAERAFWSHILGCQAKLVPPIDSESPEWWADYQLDQRAEEAMARRGG